MTGTPKTMLPVAGGSYLRDPATGALQPAPPEVEPDAPAATGEKPATKPVKQPAKEA